MHAEFCVNPEDVISKINKITFSIYVETPSENNVKDILKAQKIEDIYYSLYNFGEIEIDIENKEIIGRLEENIFTFDLLNGNLKNIDSVAPFPTVIFEISTLFSSANFSRNST